MEVIKRGFKGQQNHTTSESERVGYWVDYTTTKSLRNDKVVGTHFPLSLFGEKKIHIFLSHGMHLKFGEVKGKVPSYVSEH